MNLKMRGCMLALTEEKEWEYVESPEDEIIKSFWTKELKEYINIFEKKLLSANQIINDNSPSF